MVDLQNYFCMVRVNLRTKQYSVDAFLTYNIKDVRFMHKMAHVLKGVLIIDTAKIINKSTKNFISVC